MSSRIVLIHNDEIERLNYIRPLLTRMSKDFNLKFHQISQQSLKHINLINAIEKRVVLELSNYRLRKYWNIDKIKFFCILIDLIKFFYSIFSRSSFRKQHIHRLKIEDALTLKHIEAINGFAQSCKDDDVLFVFESDAYIKDVEYFNLVVSQIILDVTVTDLFMLAFPFTFNELNLKNSEKYYNSRNDLLSIDYPKFIFNTTVCYAVSGNLAKKISGYTILEKKNKSLAPADFYLNDILFKISDALKHKNKEITRIYEPSPVLNGSFTELYKSTVNPKILNENKINTN